MALDWYTALIPGVTASLLLFVVAIRLSQRRANRNLPPLVPGLPFLGNVLQFFSLNHTHMTEWKKQHGPIYSLNAFGNIIVVIASAAVASDILDKMSAVTSSRPNWIMAGELMTRNNLIVTQKYGNKWRKHRRGVNEVLRFSDQFFPVQEHEALLLVRDLGSRQLSEDDLEATLRRAGASILWRTLYGGPPLKASGDKNLEEIGYVTDRIVEAVNPGLGGIVDFIPPLNYLPTSLAPFKQFADRFFVRADSFFKTIAGEAIEHESNFCTLLNDQKIAHGLSDEDVAWISGVMFVGGTESGSAALKYFILAMILHPDVGSKAREELDREVGARPPTFGDRDRLPYIEAIMKEVLRWRPIAPINAPHVVTEDVTYQGHTIPKGAMILADLWSITHDPELFDEPDTFMPERFLELDDSEKRSPNVRCDDLAFGYGRRICGGRQIAMNTLFINIATLLWAFEFHKAVDDQGNEITPSTTEFVNIGLVSRAKPFPYKLVLRSAGVIERLQSML